MKHWEAILATRSTPLNRS